MKTQNWLLKQAQALPNHIAVFDSREKLSFLELKEKVEELVGKLEIINPGKRVGLLAKNNLVTYQLALAIICSGRSIVWLNWRLATEELMRQIDDSQLQVCLVEDSLWRGEMDSRFEKFTAFKIGRASCRERV